MNFVLDTNSFALFMDRISEFKPLWDKFRSDPNVKIVVGGSKYNEEIIKCNRFFNFLNELKKTGKVFRADTQKVDSKACEIQAALPADCDDPHLIALLDVAHCYIFVSQDRRADEFIKGWKYSDGKKRHIYRYCSHGKLLKRYLK